LPNIINTIENVFPGFFRFDSSFSFMFLRCLNKQVNKCYNNTTPSQPNLEGDSYLQSPEWVGTLQVPVKELGRLGCGVQHMLSG